MRDPNKTEAGRTEAGKANTKLVGGILLALALTGGAASVASAQADAPAAEPTPAVQAEEVEAVDGDLVFDDGEAIEVEGCDFDFDDLSDEEKAELVEEITAENEAIKEALDAAGIAYTVEIDEELGVEYIVWDFEDEAANEIVDDLFNEQWAEDFASLDQAERDQIIAEVTAENEAIKAALDAAGIAYTEVQDEVLGIPMVEWDFDDEAAWDVLEDVFEELDEGSH